MDLLTPGIEVEEFIDELLEWQKQSGVDFVQVRDPNGVPTYDEEGQRVREYNVSELLRMGNEVARRAQSDPLYFASRRYAMKRAAQAVLEERKKREAK
jgi:hypothetical protein